VHGENNVRETHSTNYTFFESLEKTKIYPTNCMFLFIYLSSFKATISSKKNSWTSFNNKYYIYMHYTLMFYHNIFSPCNRMAVKVREVGQIYSGIVLCPSCLTSFGFEILSFSTLRSQALGACMRLKPAVRKTWPHFAHLCDQLWCPATRWCLYKVWLKGI